MKQNDDVFRGYGVEVRLAVPDDFLKVKETLTRMGVSSRDGSTLVQSCTIFHKRGRYSIFHFKEMFAFDGKYTQISEDDLSRRDTIVKLLQDWGLLTVINPSSLRSNYATLKIISFKDKHKVRLVSKYNVGRIKQ